MNQGATALLMAAGLIPWIVAVRRNRDTTLRHALGWAIAAWIAWGWALIAWDFTARYVALTLTGCAGVAVFGARRPGVAAWHFVVAGLLAIMLLPLAEGQLTGAAVPLDTIRTTFLIGLCGAVIANYLPTRLGIAVLALSAGIGLAMRQLLTGDSQWRDAAALVIAAVPWLGWIGFARRAQESTVNQKWRDFRDRFGVLWSLRVQDQFNRAAANAGTSNRLTWWGTTEVEAQADARLTAIISRFGREGRQVCHSERSAESTGH